MQVLADALATHWNKLSRDKLYKKAVNRDPGMFRLRLVCLLPCTCNQRPGGSRWSWARSCPPWRSSPSTSSSSAATTPGAPDYSSSVCHQHQVLVQQRDRVRVVAEGRLVHRHWSLQRSHAGVLPQVWYGMVWQGSLWHDAILYGMVL